MKSLVLGSMVCIAMIGGESFFIVASTSTELVCLGFGISQHSCSQSFFYVQIELWGSFVFRNRNQLMFFFLSYFILSGILWYSIAIFCRFGKYEAIKFQVVEFACQAIDGNECRGPLLCSHLCSSTLVTYSDPVYTRCQGYRSRCDLSELYFFTTKTSLC